LGDKTTNQNELQNYTTENQKAEPNSGLANLGMVWGHRARGDGWMAGRRAGEGLVVSEVMKNL
jgi:hypothetical protein